MIPRRWLVALAIVSGLVAGAVFELAMQREDVVVIARDIAAPRPLTAEDVEVRSLSAGLAPADAAHRRDDVLGLIPSAPLLRGQIVLSRSLSDELADFSSGLPIPAGLRAIAIPVSAISAVGGAVMSGARVDVIAVPVPGRAPAGRTAELLASSAVVLDVRSESGVAVASREPKPGTAVSDRIASVVIAIAAADEIRVADRIATSTFVLALASAR